MNRSENRTGRPIPIDKFTVPKQGKYEFIERMQINRSFIKSLTGERDNLLNLNFNDSHLTQIPKPL